MTDRQPAEYYLKSIEEGFKKMKNILIQRFTYDNSTIMTNHSQLRQKIYQFNQAKATTKQKVDVNKYVRSNIQDFIYRYISVKLLPLDKLSQDPYKFVQTLNRLWTHYQIFIFCHYFACEKINEFFGSFYRMNNAKDYEYRIEESKSQVKYEIAPIPTIGVNELKVFFEKYQMIESFKSIFNRFLLDERSEKNVPRFQIRESIHSLESCYFDMDASCELEDQKPRIVKREVKNQKLSNNRRSKDGLFFSNHLLDQTLLNLGKFYSEQFVESKAMSLNSTDEIRRMIEIIAQEQARASYYIHSKQNRQKYIITLNVNLIIKNLPKRIMKEDGLKRYLQLYEEGKDQYLKELKDFWQVYSRVIDESLPYIKELFNGYLIMQAKKVGETVKIPPKFVEQLIRINSKCLKITEIFGNNFDLQNDRNSKIRDMMSNCVTEAGKKQAKFDYGAKNLASFINNKFKTSYTKGGITALGDSYKQLVALFKILLQKSRFIDEYHKHLGNRLLQQIQFSNDLDTGNILTLQKLFIEQIQKQCGVSEVRELTQVIKDIEKSIENNSKLKAKVRAELIYPLNQIIIKNANNWPERNTYNVSLPPNIINKSYNVISEYFKKQNANIQFEFNSGVSLFKGEFDNGKKQNFQFKNIYLMILLYIDQERQISYGYLKKSIESAGINKIKGQIDLAKALIELYYTGLVTSRTKSIKSGTDNICKILQSDLFEINRNYDFVQEEKRKKGGKGPAPKPMPIIKGNVLTLSEELKKGFEEEARAYNNDQKLIEAERKFKVECITVKTLKHAHHHNMNCNFQQLFKVTQEGKNKQFRVNQKFLKEVIQELIIKRYCQRIQGQRNVFRYIA